MNVGDIVVLLAPGSYDSGPHNPVWGGDGLFLKGIVQGVDFDGETTVEWENGYRANYYPQQCQLVLFSALPADQIARMGDKKARRATGMAKEFDLAELDKLVIEESKRLEIIALLKQQEHGKKLFDEWGLGETIEYGRGMNLLFWGNPGTGKTWGVTCIAKALGKEVITISAAEIQTSEPGGANRNIQEAFRQAKAKDAILFLDECDSLICSRNEVGMILGSEINTLLTEIEQSEGVTILATNMIENLDPALERRLALILEFPEPDFAARKGIWERLIPSKMPREDNADSEWLASYVLTGGQIKNVLLQAARMAIAEEAEKVTRAHFENAIKRLNASKGLMGQPKRARPHRGGASVGMGKSGKTIEREVVKEEEIVDTTKSN